MGWSLRRRARALPDSPASGPGMRRRRYQGQGRSVCAEMLLKMRSARTRDRPAKWLLSTKQQFALAQQACVVYLAFNTGAVLVTLPETLSAKECSRQSTASRSGCCNNLQRGAEMLFSSSPKQTSLFGKSECKSCSDKANLAHDGLQSSCVIATSVSCLGKNST